MKKSYGVKKYKVETERKIYKDSYLTGQLGVNNLYLGTFIEYYKDVF